MQFVAELMHNLPTFVSAIVAVDNTTTTSTVPTPSLTKIELCAKDISETEKEKNKGSK